jgi:hypothetical protein
MSVFSEEIITGIYFPISTYQKYKQEVKRLGDEYEKTRDPTIIHKYNGTAFVDSKIHVTFTNGKIDSAWHNGKLLPLCSTRRKNLSDIKFSINDIVTFNELLDKHKNIVVSLNYCHDGWVWNQSVKMFVDDREVGDFSIFGD